MNHAFKAVEQISGLGMKENPSQYNLTSISRRSRSRRSLCSPLISFGAALTAVRKPYNSFHSRITTSASPTAAKEPEATENRSVTYSEISNSYDLMRVIGQEVEDNE